MCLQICVSAHVCVWMSVCLSMIWIFNHCRSRAYVCKILKHAYDTNYCLPVIFFFLISLYTWTSFSSPLLPVDMCTKTLLTCTVIINVDNNLQMCQIQILWSAVHNRKRFVLFCNLVKVMMQTHVNIVFLFDPSHHVYIDTSNYE